VPDVREPGGIGVTYLYCAEPECRARFEPDDDHYRVEIERRTTTDGVRGPEFFVLCPDCYFGLTDNWGEPA
jgi:hypothetical protein